MKNYSSLIIASFVLLFFSSPVEALLKIDVGGSAAEITKTVSGYVESAKKKMDESVAIQTAIIYGKGAIEFAKQAKEVKEIADDKIAKAKAIKDNPLGNGIDFISDLTEDEKFQQVTNKITEKTADAIGLGDLQEKKDKLTEDINKKISAEQKTVQNKIAVYDKNNAKLQQMIKDDPKRAEEYKLQIDKNNAEKKALETGLELSTKKLSAESLASLTDVNSQLGSLNDKLQSAATAAKNKVEKELTDKVLGFDSGGALNETVSKNYIGKDDIEDNSSITQVQSYRRYIAVQDVVDVGAKVVPIKQKLDDSNVETKKYANRVGAMEGSISAINMDTQVKVQNVKALAQYLEVMLLDLKMRSSGDLASIEENKIREPGADITSFNLDEYIYEPTSASGEK